MGLRFDPMGGGQFKSAMNAIIEAEKQPIKALEKRKEQENAKLKLFGDFKTKFNNLRSSLSSVIGFNKFKELKAELGDGSQFMTVSIDKEKANVGSWDVEIKELAERSSMISNGFSDPNKKILGVGYIQFDLPDGGSQEVYVTKNDASLYGIAAKINSVPDSPVKATVLKDVTDAEKPYRLVITSKKDGSDNEVKFPQMYFVDGQEELYVEQDKGAKNALLEVDGFEIELPSNENPDFLQGVGVQLKQAKPGQKFTMNVKADYPKVTEKLKKVIEGMRRSNRAAASALRAAGDAVHAVTDVTGYGLAGHGWEMADRSGVRLTVDTVLLPAYDGARRIAAGGTRTGGDPRNREYVRGNIEVHADDDALALCMDPQTSGGLLAAADRSAVARLVDEGFMVIGRFDEGPAGITVE